MDAYKVMVPLDGSRVAEHSLVYLDALRCLGESEVLLLSVVDESEEYRSLTIEEARDREENLLSTYLREVGSDLEQHLGIQSQRRVVRGAPATKIIEQAEAYGPDVLVISTHGRSGPSRWRFGSVADKVIRGAAANTLVVGPKAAETGKWLEARLMPAFKAILVPLDGSELAEQAMPLAKTFAEAFDSKVHLVRVVDIPVAADPYGSGALYTTDIIDSMVEPAREYLGEVSARYELGDRAWIEVLVGTAVAALDTYMTGNAIDLVIMTTHGRGGVLRAALGSVTDRLLGGVAPVLVVRAGEKE